MFVNLLKIIYFQTKHKHLTFDFDAVFRSKERTSSKKDLYNDLQLYCCNNIVAEWSIQYFLCIATRFLKKNNIGARRINPLLQILLPLPQPCPNIPPHQTTQWLTLLPSFPIRTKNCATLCKLMETKHVFQENCFYLYSF